MPWLDTLWDGLHTVVRPLGGAFIAVATLGEASPMVQGLIALLGGGVAASTHLTKADASVANTSPEPFSNWLLSLAEDVFVLGLGALTLKFPLIALLVAVVLLALIAWFFVYLVRARRGAAALRDTGHGAAAPARQLPTLKVSFQPLSGWPSVATMPFRAITSTARNGSSGEAN